MSIGTPMGNRLNRTSLTAAARGTAVIVVLALLAGAVGCGSGDRQPLLVFAAASLKDPVTELGERFEEQSGVGVDVSFSGSQSLARQIVAGAPADVFVSAGVSPVDLLLCSGLVDDRSARELLTNRLVVVTRTDGAQVDSLDSLTADGVTRVAIVNPDLGPAGWYAEQSLRSSGLWELLLPKLVFTQDVRATLTYVQAGNADAGFVYRTDAATAPELSVAVVVPTETHSPIVYLGVVLSESARSTTSAAFLEFLASEQATEVFRSSGFTESPGTAGSVLIGGCDD